MMKPLALLLFFIFPFCLTSQILTVNPELPSVNDNITLIYDASLGNGELAGYNGSVYMHTGVITTHSTYSGDWKYVVTNWCENSEETKMVSLGNNRYQAQYNIRELYGIPDNETVLQMAFVFRSEDCNLVGRSDEGGDIFYNVQYDFSTKYESYTLTTDNLIIHCNEGDITITPFTNTVFNIFSAQEDEPNAESYSVTGQKENVVTSFSEDNHNLYYNTDSTHLVINKDNLRFSFVFNNDTVVSFVKVFNFQWGGSIISGLTDNEKIYGTGSRAIEMDRRGRTLAVNNQAHYGYGYGTENLNITVPHIVSSNGYSVFYDNHSIATLDIGNMNSNQLAYNFTNGQADIYVITGSTHSCLNERLSYLTGHHPLPPLWSLGYIQSKYGYESEYEARNIVNEIIDADFPIDALVLDLYWFGNTNTMGNLNWDYTRFPTPVDMMSDFRDAGVKTILITEPYFTLNSTNYSFASNNGYMGKNTSGQTYVLYGFWAGDAALLDIFNPAAAQWVNQFYTARANEGASGWWTDLGEPESHPEDMIHYNGLTSSEVHNVYALQWEDQVYNNWRNNFPDKRLFNLSRSGFTGMQRYSTFPWSGDIQRSFGGLQAQIPIMLSMGLDGISTMHSDIGGFTGGDKNDELFVRWVQMGTFAPVFRIHGTGIETSPTSYGSNAINISRNFIKLRYELLPYNYTLSYYSTTQGLPLARPMDYYDMNNSQLQNINDQYYWGENFIVAPVLNQGQTQRDVILPEGKWINYFNLDEFTGPGTFSMDCPLSTIPVLVKAASFIPIVEDIKSTDNYTADALTIRFYPDKDIVKSEYTLFDDNRQSPFSIYNAQYSLINFSSLYIFDNLSIVISDDAYGYQGMPDTREFVFEIFRINHNPQNVKVNDNNISSYSTMAELLNNDFGYYYNSTSDILYTKVDYSNSTLNIDITGLDQDGINTNNDNVMAFSVYPNPGNDIVYINRKNKSTGLIEIEVFDMSGRVVSAFKTTENNSAINTSQLPDGIYSIRINDGKSCSVGRWVKK